jgi:hypothetical protein
LVQGIKHLEQRLVRCPDEFSRIRAWNIEQGLESFTDDEDRERKGTWLRISEDPLRSLRAIRFSLQNAFTLSPVLKEVLRSEEIRQGLLVKTKPERKETELTKILHFPLDKACECFKLLADFKLLGSVFPMVCTQNIWRLYTASCIRSLQYARASSEAHKVNELIDQGLVVFSFLFAPLWGDYQYPNGAHHPMPFTRVHMKDHWKVKQI